MVSVHFLGPMRAHAPVRAHLVRAHRPYKRTYVRARVRLRALARPQARTRAGAPAARLEETCVYFVCNTK